MIGRKATIGLALLCALLFSAIAVQSAGAVPATNTTAFTCVKGGGELDFSDAHCDKKVEAKKGEYGHVALPVGKAVEVEGSNVTTGGATVPGLFFAEPFKVKTEIECAKGSGTGTVTNVESGAKTHNVVGTGAGEVSNCTVKKPAKCTVKEPIVGGGEGEGVEELEGKKEMGGEGKPPGGGKVYSTVTLEGAECALKGKPFNVEGTAIGTSGSGSQTNKWSGATAILTKAMTEKTLKAAEKFAWAEATATVVAKGGGNPIVVTTVT